ncbi:hypothetical protein HGM15179_000074, partial [Zosterops borbonicus]
TSQMICQQFTRKKEEIARIGSRSGPASVSIEIKPKEMDPSLFKMNFLYTKTTKETEATFLNTEKQRIK